jgi:hypothetical protein
MKLTKKTIFTLTLCGDEYELEGCDVEELVWGSIAGSEDVIAVRKQRNGSWKIDMCSSWNRDAAQALLDYIETNGVPDGLWDDGE